MRNNKFPLLKIFAICVLLTLVGVTVNEVLAQQLVTDEQARMKQAGEAADQLIRQFRETLDIGVVFDKMASSHARQLLQSGDFFANQIEPYFFQSLDGKTKERLFKAEMNYRYIGFAYSLTFMNNLGCDEKETITWPDDLKNFAAKSKFLRDLLGTDNSQNIPQIDTSDDLALYLAEIDHVIALLRKHLPRNYYELKSYQENYKKYVQAQDWYMKPRVEVEQGRSYLGVPNNTQVFLVTRDIFSVYFVEENGQMKILTFVIGN